MIDYFRLTNADLMLELVPPLLHIRLGVVAWMMAKLDLINSTLLLSFLLCFLLMSWMRAVV